MLFSGIDEFREEIVRALAQKATYIIVNFDREHVYEIGGGHHSPIAAYHEPSDRLLILDVAR